MNPPTASRGHVAAYLSLLFATAVSVSAYFGLERVWTLAIPVVISGLPILISPVVSRRRLRIARWVSAALLAAWVVIAGFSVGNFYVPSAVAMFIAAVRTGSTSHRSPTA